MNQAAAKRPSLAKKQTRSSKEKQDSLLDEGVRIIIGDTTYEVRAGDLNGLHVRELRRQVGVTFLGLVTVLSSEHFDVDMVAALIWLRRIIDGERVTYNEVASETGYDVLQGDFEVTEPQDGEDDSSPEA